MRNSYSIFIKSHANAPDYEETILARNRKQAVELFYMKLGGEFDRGFIDKNIAREYKNGKLK